MDISLSNISSHYLPPTQQGAEPIPAVASEGYRVEPKTAQPQALSPRELHQVEQLKLRDREVRAHELAHKAIAGQYAKGAPSFDYQVGPDGRRYAVGGEVSIDISKESDPEQTLKKALVIRRAAMAPAVPSAQDRQIALQAAVMATEARQEIGSREQATEEVSSDQHRQSGQASADSERRPFTASERRAIAGLTRSMALNLEPPQAAIDQFV